MVEACAHRGFVPLYPHGRHAVKGTSPRRRSHEVAHMPGSVKGSMLRPVDQTSAVGRRCGALLIIVTNVMILVRAT